MASLRLLPRILKSQIAVPTTSTSSLNIGYGWTARIPCFSHARSLSSTADASTVTNAPPSEDFSQMSNEDLADNSTIPGWDLVTSPPRKYPRGALVGTVVSDKMQKTVNVAVNRYRLVPKIRKRMKFTRKFMAHDEEEVANLGDLVMITPCQRISKRKHFMLREIIRPKGQL